MEVLSLFSFRIKSARLQKGFTQQVLADAIGVSKQAISQYENGKKKPESTTLISLAKVLEKPVDFFFRPIVTPLGQVDFRKRASLKGQKLEAIKTSIQDKLEPYLELENYLGIQASFSNPLYNKIISNLEDVEAAAVCLLDAWQLGLNPIPNILEMLESQGIKVIESKTNLQFDGLSTWVNDNIPVIVINGNFDNLRKRFTALHELGHLLLVFPKDSTHKFIEKACNRFAGAMLLPQKVILKELGIKRSKISLLELIPIKEYYGISLAAIVYRARDLDIFPDGVVKRFWQWRNQSEQHRKEEDFGKYLGEEKAYRFDQLLYKALAEELITLSKAASLANQSLSSMKTIFTLI